MRDSRTKYDAEAYHALCSQLWKVVREDGVNDCATIAVEEIKTLRHQLSLAVAEIAAWREHADEQARGNVAHPYTNIIHARIACNENPALAAMIEAASKGESK